jgi:predicted CopG family antitoxin
MNTKLTLTIEKEVIEKAKNYAKNKNRSLSDIIENYLKSLTTTKNNNEEKKLSPIVQSLKGSFMTDKDLDYKKELQNRLEKKYL